MLPASLWSHFRRVLGRIVVVTVSDCYTLNSDCYTLNSVHFYPPPQPAPRPPAFKENLSYLAFTPPLLMRDHFCHASSLANLFRWLGFPFRFGCDCVSEALFDCSVGARSTLETSNHSDRAWSIISFDRLILARRFRLKTENRV